MSKKGREMAERCADWVMMNAPGISKAYGTRDALVDSFGVHGAFLAAVEAEKRKVIRANDKLIKQYKRADELQQRALSTIIRSQQIDELTLPRAEAYSVSTTIPFEPAEFMLARKPEPRTINGYNGHAQTDLPEAAARQSPAPIGTREDRGPYRQRVHQRRGAETGSYSGSSGSRIQRKSLLPGTSARGSLWTK